VDANSGVPEVFIELRNAIQTLVGDLQNQPGMGGGKPGKKEKRR